MHAPWTITALLLVVMVMMVVKQASAAAIQGSANDSIPDVSKSSLESEQDSPENSTTSKPDHRHERASYDTLTNLRRNNIPDILLDRSISTHNKVRKVVIRRKPVTDVNDQISTTVESVDKNYMPEYSSNQTLSNDNIKIENLPYGWVIKPHTTEGTVEEAPQRNINVSISPSYSLFVKVTTLADEPYEQTNPTPTEETNSQFPPIVRPLIPAPLDDSQFPSFIRPLNGFKTTTQSHYPDIIRPLAPRNESGVPDITFGFRSDADTRDVSDAIGDTNPRNSNRETTVLDTVVGKMDETMTSMVLYLLLVVCSILFTSLLILAGCWFRAKHTIRKLDRSIRAACVQGLDPNFAVTGL